VRPNWRTRKRACGVTLYRVPVFRITEAAKLLGVSDDTVRRWLDSGQLPVELDQSRRMAIDGVALAAFARDHAHSAPDPTSQVGRSTRNRFVGLVTNVIADTVMTQIELQCGPHRVVSLISAEAARELGLVPGSLAVAVVPPTHVVIETPGPPRRSEAVSRSE
jgi:molybdopterin-binding protein